MKHTQQSHGFSCRVFVLAALLLFSVFSSQDTYSQTRKFLVAYGGVSGTTAPLWLTKQEKLFEKQGLQVDLLASTRGFLEREPEVSKRFLKAYAEGYALYRSNREAALRALAKYMKLDDPEMLEETYREFTGKFQTPKPYPSMAGIKLVLDSIAKKSPKASGSKPEDFVFLKYLDEVTGGKP
ncbi:MAG: hypothetical protein HYY65_05255 [Candidatus Tectomicrobia bacterium]|uniref:ABC transporter substrate-binding protein n=1 Tax=Tectimicrobiota bacterium TaxID=2528274 RepID=A0A932GP16_UNCTE|nr:hypothetical protein [Candidatus Tectomicrobia bacterium]